jgi:hypothetical protein
MLAEAQGWELTQTGHLDDRLLVDSKVRCGIAGSPK